MASIPSSGLDLWVTVNEIKKIKVKHFYLPNWYYIEHKTAGLSRRIWPSLPPILPYPSWAEGNGWFLSPQGAPFRGFMRLSQIDEQLAPYIPGGFRMGVGTNVHNPSKTTGPRVDFS
jgi:hypothetical protein